MEPLARCGLGDPMMALQRDWQRVRVAVERDDGNLCPRADQLAWRRDVGRRRRQALLCGSEANHTALSGFVGRAGGGWAGGGRRGAR